MASTFKRKKQPSAAAATSTAATSTAAGIISNNSGSSSSMLGLKGTKPWTGGTTLTSFGLRDMDGILGGGQPIGTCILIEEDRWTQSLAASLVRYWCAEAISQQQQLLIPSSIDNPDNKDWIFRTPFSLVDKNDKDEHENKKDVPPAGASPSDIQKLLESLPRNLHWDKQKAKAHQSSSEEAATAVSKPLMMETFMEEDEEDEHDEGSDHHANANEAGLKIAWQYRTDVQRERLGKDATTTTSTTNSRSSASDIYCHSYDLSGQLGEQENLDAATTSVSVQCCDVKSSICRRSRACGIRLYQRLLTELEKVLANHPRRVVRLLLYRRDADTLCTALPLLLAQIRSKHMPVVVLVSVQPWTTLAESKHWISLRRTSDVVLQAEGFAARSTYPPPAEFRHLHGLLLIRKVSTVTAATAIDGGHYADLTMSKRPPANIYGLKRDRRKLNIPLLHIPPEDHAEGGGSVGGGGVRSGAGRPSASKQSTSPGCSSGSGNSLLDF